MGPHHRRNQKPVTLLSGGNPQIAKAEGDAPVQAYIAAMPGWKRRLGERLDALIVRTVPTVRKAVKWNSPMYGREDGGLFVAFHTFERYVKVTFFQGTSLQPAPPGGTGKEARWIDVHEHDLDEDQMAKWVRQAAALPGWSPGTPAKPEKTGTPARVRATGTSRAGARRTSTATASRKPGVAALSGSALIDERIREVGGWRGETLARMRALILEADPEMVEERKWVKPTNPAGVPVWSHDGIVCTGEVYKSTVKLTFARGARLPDPARLFNASLEGNTRRAIDIREGETVNARAFRALVRAAIAENRRARGERRGRGERG